MKIDDLSFERVIKMLQGTQSQMSMPWAWVDYSSGGEGERLLSLILSHHHLPSTFSLIFLLVLSTMLKASDPIISSHFPPSSRSREGISQ